MSRFLGLLGPDAAPLLAARMPAARFTHAAGLLALCAEGPPETLRAGLLPEGGGGWLVAGLALAFDGEAVRPLDDAAWARRLAGPAPALDGLDGHFVGLRWHADGPVTLFADALGVRTAYLARTPRGVAFGTRLDDLAALRPPVALCLDAFAGHWLAINALTPTPLLEGVEALSPGGRATVTAGGWHRTARPWAPPSFAPDPEAPARFTARLRAFATAAVPGRALTLGLSGGLDSRALLALAPPPHLHTFGPDAHPDVQTARRLAAHTGRPHRVLHAPLPDADACLHLVEAQVRHTHAASPASSAPGLDHFARLYADGLAVVDGGFGEVARRQFMNRLLRRAPQAARAGRAAAIAPHLRVRRAAVFAPEVQAALEAGLVRDVGRLWAALPAGIGAEAAADLAGVRARLPFFFGPEQARLDAQAVAFMPFAQPSVLAALFQVPLAQRRNGRLLRRLIRARAPALARVPLVKGGYSYPFALPTLAAFAWTALHARLAPPPPDATRAAFLERLRPFALDAVHSQAVAQHPLYDGPRLQALVAAYYAGETRLAGAVDWWLAFEVWRRAVGL